MTNPTAPTAALQQMRACLYARYSTDKQRESSIDDQLRAARERAEREGWRIVTQHADQGVSGSTPVALRPGGKLLLADALAHRFDILIVEGLDRLSREIGEAETITKRLEYQGIRIIGTADGYDSEARGKKVMRIARGLVNELYLDDLREKTHRGLAGQFDRGHHVGGVTFGYRSGPTPCGKGRQLTIDPVQAAIVTRIFTDFAAGHSARGIVHALNNEGATSPRGGTWAVSALVGDSKRGAGVLNNELYVGNVIWNRRQWLKDPETGARRYVDRPESEWQRRDAPELRILPEALWEAVRQRARSGPARGTRTGRGAAPKTLFAGLLRCPECSGPIVAIDARRYGCNRRNDRGPAACGHGEGYPRERVDSALLRSVRDDLLSPEAMADVQREVRAALAEHGKSGRKGADIAQRRLAELHGEIGRLVDAVAALGLSASLRARLEAAELEREAVSAQVDSAKDVRPALTADEVLASYNRQLQELRKALEEESDRDHTRALLAELLGPVRLVREGKNLWAEIEEPATRLLVAGSTPTEVVAGARFELATCGL